MIWKRLKNLWALSVYTVEHLGSPDEFISRPLGGIKLRKNIPTIKKKLATIIVEQPDYFSPEDAEAS